MRYGLIGLVALLVGCGCGLTFLYGGVPAKIMGGPLDDLGEDASVAPDGSFFTVGSFRDTATFGSGEPNESILSSADDLDVYVAHFGSDMTLRWTVRAGGSDVDRARGVAVIDDGGAVVVGDFSQDCTFAMGEANETTFTSIGVSHDGFVARYTDSGTLLFALLLRSTEQATPRAVESLPDGSFVVAGSFRGTTTFGLGQPNETSHTHGGAGTALFVARFDASGQLVWVRVGGSVGFSTAVSVAVTDTGRVLVCGQLEGMTNFGQGVVLNAVGTDGFLASYEPNGVVTWATRQAGAFDEACTDVSVLANGACVVTGFSDQDPVFAPGEPNETALTGARSFVARYAPDGTMIWARNAGGVSADGIATLSDGSCVAAGAFSMTATFGASEPSEISLTSVGGTDIFVIRLDPAGSLVWARRVSGAMADTARYVRTLPASHVIVGGQSESTTVVFGPGERNETTVNSAGGSDAIIGRFGSDGVLR